MADERLRQLERAAADGDHGARVRWYQARVRLGDLTEHRLWLAAHLGDVAARDALGEGRHVEAEGFDDWVRILTGGGKEVCVRAALAATRISATSDRWGDAFAAVEAWVACPCRDHARRARSVHEELQLRRTPHPILAMTQSAGELNLSRAAQAAAAAIQRERPWPEPTEDLSDELTASIRDAIAANLLPWLLAARDPLPPTELSS